MSRLRSYARLIGRLVKGQQSVEYVRFLLAERITAAIYPKYRFSEFGRLFLEDEEFRQYHDRYVHTKRYRSLDRKYTLDQLLKLVTTIDGDTAECGAFEGASSYLICRRIEGSNKQHHVFDSFAGLSAPSQDDGVYWTRGDLAIGESAIRKTLGKFDFVVYHTGWIPERFHEVADLKFSFVHVDVDLHAATLASLRFFYPRVSRGGVILCDDYGFRSCPGAKKAMDEFFLDKVENIVCLPTGQGLVIRS